MLRLKFIGVKIMDKYILAIPRRFKVECGFRSICSKQGIFWGLSICVCGNWQLFAAAKKDMHNLTTLVSLVEKKYLQ